jgi:hypothetical protein
MKILGCDGWLFYQDSELEYIRAQVNSISVEDKIRHLLQERRLHTKKYDE